MHERLSAEIDKQAAAFGVTREAVLGRDRTRQASAARRAVWANVITRHLGGEFPSTELARIFGRQANVIRAGVTMHRMKLLKWPRRIHSAKRSLDVAIEQNQLRALRNRYRKMAHSNPLRSFVRAECARVSAKLKEMEPNA